MYVRIHSDLFSIQAVPGDGDCFFHCLSYSLHKNLYSSSMLRNVICQNIIENWSKYEKKSIYAMENMSPDQFMLLEC